MAMAIQTLEDERMESSQMPLLVLSEEVVFCPHPTLSQSPSGTLRRERGLPSPSGRAGDEGNLF